MNLRTQALLVLGLVSALSFTVSANAQYADNAQLRDSQFNVTDLSALPIPQPNPNFPIGPDATTTPGALCTSPTAYRYAEHVPYCNRNVDSDTKRQLIRMYDAKFGFRIEQMDRQKFKIDHFIPLCAGGANSTDNLWPQHESVYALTDSLEAIVCQKMSDGRLLQRDAVAYIRQAKLNLSQAAAITAHVQSL